MKTTTYYFNPNRPLITPPVFEYDAASITTTSPTTWPNTGSGGASYNLVPIRDQATWYPSNGPNGQPTVGMPTSYSGWQTAVDSGIEGSQGRTFILVAYSPNDSRHYFSVGLPRQYGSNFSFGNANAQINLAMAGVDWNTYGFRPHNWQLITVRYRDNVNQNYEANLKIDELPMQTLALPKLVTVPATLQVGAGSALYNSNPTSPLYMALFQGYDYALTDAELLVQLKAIGERYGMAH